jgi:hypothetical protein
MATDPYKSAQQQAYDEAAQSWSNWLAGGNAPTTRVDDYGIHPAGTSARPTIYSSTGAQTVQRNLPYVSRNTADPDSRDVSKLPFNDWGRNFEGNWWANIPQATFGDIINDPEKYTRMWAQANKLGEQTQGRLQEFAPMPVNFLYGLGEADKFTGSANFPMQKQAALQDQFLDRILRGNNYMDPRQLMSTALDAVVVKDQNGNYVGSQNPLAMQFGDPAVPAETQADNMIKYVASTVGKLVPQGHAQALINIYQREKSLFSDYLTKNPKVNITFNKWIKDRLGPTGGL